MKKLLLIGMILCSFLLVGCFKYTEKDVVSDLDKNLKKSDGYTVKGELVIDNSGDQYKYDVNASYQKGDNFRVSLKNQSNNHEQIILRNADGVYVLTPSVNKSFKFQSDWPFNNSQAYLLHSLIQDIKDDAKRTYKEEKENYVFTTKVNYPNNRILVNQKIYFDKKLKPVKVEVLDKDNNAQITMKFTSVDMDASFDKTYFSLNENMRAAATGDEVSVSAKIDDVVYPMFMPADTKLQSQDTIAKETGERVIMTFVGESPFMLVQETASKEAEHTVIPMYGEPEILLGTVGALSDNSVSWIANGKEYYLVSEVLSKMELLEVVNSITSIPIAK